MNMNDTRTGKKDKYQRIRVFVRVRPINNIEKNSKSKEIVEIPNDKELIVHECPLHKFSKKFKFDHVFGPSSKQVDVYNAVVSPLLTQVLAGYNCTVLAYGQTGTGKTFTMEGINSNSTLHWQSDSTAGIIPRSLSHLFDRLQLSESPEYRIRVSFLELYNEELFDLLSTNDDASKIALYEDTSKKGALIINGLEEVTVHNKWDVYKILEEGSARRQTAATLINAQSSRSHTLFSITVQMKENTVDGEEVLKSGKLNLVDLAGSENVGRSGAVDKRAREAGSVNQSLLSLGRVITALVERAPHIPYRESKLTRLLQESLNGCTKTSIIATVSPASINLEETLSTLDYTHRAKNITIRPEINLKLSKKEFLKQYTEEIERLRKDLLATREKNGVHLATDNYNEMQAMISQQEKEIEKKIHQIRALEKSMLNKEVVFQELKLEDIAQEKKLNEGKKLLNTVIEALNSTEYRLKVTEQQRNEQRYLVEKHISTEQVLLSQAQTLLNIADTATADSHKLHNKINRKTETEQTFEVLSEQFKNKMHESIQGIKNDVSTYGDKLKQFCCTVRNDIDAQIVTKFNSIGTEINQTSINLTDQHLTKSNNLTKNINESFLNYQDWVKDEVKNTAGTVEYSNEFVNAVSTKLTQNINILIRNKIAENLKFMQANLSEKLEQAKIRINDMIVSACNNEKEACNRLKENLEIIKKSADVLHKKQEFTEKQRSFATMMENVSSQFNLLKESQQEHYDTVISKCDNIKEICDTVDNQSTNAYNKILRTRSDLQEQVKNNLKKIENTVTVGVEMNKEVAIRTMKEEKMLLNKLKSSTNASCDISKQYQNTFECNFKEMQRKMDVDKNECLSVINDVQKTVADVSKDHEFVVKDQYFQKKCNTFEEISRKVENRVSESNASNTRVLTRLNETVDEINKFFDEDIQRDVPTGSTPTRKEFSYPRQFTITSPHEKILQRFRDIGKMFETSEVDFDTSI